MKSAYCVLVLTALLFQGAHFVPAVESSGDQEAEYRKSIQARSQKIVSALEIQDSDKASRARNTIAEQYYSLRKIHEARDQKIKSLTKDAGSDKVAIERAPQPAKEEAKGELDRLHGQFLEKLSKDLNPEQVEKVKDGMTYGVVPLTYGVYLKMYPTLNEDEKKQIMSWLKEAREIAMDQGTSDEKHGVFNKYKGKINNFLSKAGYDSKQGRENLKKAEK